MLSVSELLKYKTTATPAVYTLGTKEVDDVPSDFDTSQLEAKLKNVEELLRLQRVRMKGQLSKAIWREDKQMAEVVDKVGSHWDHLGHMEHSKLYLYPEEALYLIDTGAMEITYNGLYLSLQRAYFLLTNATDSSLEKYRVFSQLSLLGYKVMRHCRQNVLTKYEESLGVHKVGIKHKDVRLTEAGQSENAVLNSETQMDSVTEATENLLEHFPIQYGRDDDNATIMSRLQSIGPKKEPCLGAESAVVDFDVFLPGSDNVSFRKSTVQLPALRLRVFSSTDEVPDLIELCQERNFFKDNVPLIHAIVYPDFINFLQIASVDLPDITNAI